MNRVFEIAACISWLSSATIGSRLFIKESRRQSAGQWETYEDECNHYRRLNGEVTLDKPAKKVVVLGMDVCGRFTWRLASNL